MAVLGSRFVGAEIRGKFRALSIKLGLVKLYDAVPADWAIPDTEFALQAVSAVETLCPDFMIKHCFRSVLFWGDSGG